MCKSIFVTLFSIFFYFLLFSIFCSCASKIHVDTENPVVQLAIADVRRDLSESYSEYGAVDGLCFGCAGIPIAVFSEPEPPAYRLLGRSTLYVQTYTELYQAQQKRTEIGYSVSGCCVHYIFLGIFIATVYAALQ